MAHSCLGPSLLTGALTAARARLDEKGKKWNEKMAGNLKKKKTFTKRQKGVVD